jgi:hypothetical protein
MEVCEEFLTNEDVSCEEEEKVKEFINQFTNFMNHQNIYEGEAQEDNNDLPAETLYLEGEQPIVSVAQLLEKLMSDIKEDENIMKRPQS